MMVNQGGDPFHFDPRLTPYTPGINDACDHPDVRVIAVKGPTRSAKTVSAESMVLRDWTYGPLKNVLWFMQDEDSINDYIDERGEEMLRIHTEVNERIDWGDIRNGRKRRKIGKSLLLYRPATRRALRAKAAPTIIGDEIDAYEKKIRKAIMTLVTSRQEEFGSAAKAYLASHPDEGPDDGIDAVLKDSLLSLWFARCPHCGGAASPALEAESWGVPRWTWNVPELMGRAEETERLGFLDGVAEHAVLCCPFDGCHATFGADKRFAIMAAGRWLQRHQSWGTDGTVAGDYRFGKIMGFVIHAFMTPFMKFGETARDWAAASLTANISGDTTKLKEVVCKKLGETFMGNSAEEQIEDWKTLQARLASNYALKTVPSGVKFLTAFVDVQGDRFEVRVIGWDLAVQSWLIDHYAIKQWPAMNGRSAFDNIAPATRLTDWAVIEEAVVTASYPLASNPERASAGLPELFMPIARTVINAAGEPGVTNNARVWAADMLGRQPGEGRLIAPYKILLMQGAASQTGEIYGKPKPYEFDDKGQKLRIVISERHPNVYELKRIIKKRMAITEPGPGRMHVPAGTPARIMREIGSENMRNRIWTKNYTYNETWDGWVACEVARATLRPERRILWENGSLPEWAQPRPRGEVFETMIERPVSIFDRLAALNNGAD